MSLGMKQNIVRRVIAIYLAVFLFALILMARLVQLQFLEDEEWKDRAQQQSLKYVTIEPNRGDIYAGDGRRLLATSVPYFELRMDMKSPSFTDDIFYKHVDSLAWYLARFFGDKSMEVYKRRLVRARQQGVRYYLVKRGVSYKELKEVKKFPIFREGQYRGGFRAIQENRRIRPHSILAARTVGYTTKDERGNVVGIEGAFDHYLKGQKGVRLMQKISGNMWMPVSDRNEVDPRDGSDVITTIDVDLQDVAENALLRQLINHDAHHGTAVLMEVQTGEIKAIVNLQKIDSVTYGEVYNYAIGESTEPGSTFKLASLIAALEDGIVDLDDTIDTGNGTYRVYDKVIRDTRKGGHGKITVQEAFEYSSNVGISKIIHEGYSEDPARFIDRLYSMHLNEALGVPVKGEGIPRIKYPGDPLWSGISLAMMSYGYEIRMTPLQILTFYNAIANDGKMVKPRLVKEIRYLGETEQRFRTEVIDPSICSKKTLEKARRMLEGAVQNGTAMNLRTTNYSIAGKTGTAQIANDKYGYQVDSKISYQASFVGYFPAENPCYSCIVVVNSPSSDVYYGNLVAGPVFKEIADKVYATSFDMHLEIGEYTRYAVADAPYSKIGSKEHLDRTLEYLGIPVQDSGITTDWVVTYKQPNEVSYKEMHNIPNLVPNVREMGLRDAVYLLENAGLKVEVLGRGKVRSQSIPPGTRVEPGQTITLEMSFI